MDKRNWISVIGFCLCLVTLTSCTSQPQNDDELLFVQSVRSALFWPTTYVVNITQKQVVNFSTPNQLGDWADWSPDGQWIVFSKGGLDRSDLYLMRSDGSDLQQVTNGQAGARFPVWSPDGQELAYYSGADDGLVILGLSCHLKYEVCHDEPRLIAEGLINGLSWSNDGERIVFSLQERIFIVNTLGDPIIIDVTPEFDGCYSPDWSPDGSKIAFNCYDGDKHNIILIAPDGTNTNNLTAEFEGWCFEPKWSSNSQKLAVACRYVDGLGKRLGFGDSATASSAIYLIDLAGGKPKRITSSDDEEIMWLTWIPPIQEIR